MSNIASKFDDFTSGDDVVAAFANRVSSHIFLVTGPSPTSIGFTTATALAKAHPAVIVLVGRSSAKLNKTRDAVLAIDPKIYVPVVVADLSSQASVRVAGASILADDKVPHIDVVINNAGIMAGPFEKSVDGHEMQFATNHIGHFLLTKLLAPKLRASAEGGRVVNVTSASHRLVLPLAIEEYDPLQERAEFNQWKAYGNAKLANLLFTKGLVARGFQAYAIHPGTILTGLGARFNNDISAAVAAHDGIVDLEPMGVIKTLEQGPNTQLLAALQPTTELQNGSYLWGCQVKLPSELAQDEDGTFTAKLWEVSERVTNEEFD